MAKSNRAEAAAKAAEMRAAAARKDRQHKQVITAVVAVVIVMIAVVIGVVISKQPKSVPAATGGPAALAKLVSLPEATLNAAPPPAATQFPPKVAGGEPLTVDGKPKILYVGAEFCPFCAMERWSLIGALSRFGTFEGLTETASSPADAYPDTPTFSFVGSTYKSDHVALEAVETQDRDGKPLQELSAPDKALFAKYNPGGSIPFILYGGTNATVGATVDATAFEGQSYDQIIAGILDPTSAMGKTVTPSINAMTAQICALTKGEPANVCTAKGVMSIQSQVKN